MRSKNFGRCDGIILKMALPVLFLLMTGCSMENVYHGMYEGMRIGSHRETTPGERMGKPGGEMDYRQYDQARRERLEQGKEEPGR